MFKGGEFSNELAKIFDSVICSIEKIDCKFCACMWYQNPKQKHKKEFIPHLLAVRLLKQSRTMHIASQVKRRQIADHCGQTARTIKNDVSTALAGKTFQTMHVVAKLLKQSEKSAGPCLPGAPRLR